MHFAWYRLPVLVLLFLSSAGADDDIGIAEEPVIEMSVEADSGGHTDNRPMINIFPAIRNRILTIPRGKRSAAADRQSKPRTPRRFTARISH